MNKNDISVILTLNGKIVNIVNYFISQMYNIYMFNRSTHTLNNLIKIMYNKIFIMFRFRCFILHSEICLRKLFSHYTTGYLCTYCDETPISYT